MTISRWEASPTSRDTAWFPTWFLQLLMEAWRSAPGKTWFHQCAAAFTFHMISMTSSANSNQRKSLPSWTWPHACGSEPTNTTATHTSNRARLASPRQLRDSISRVLAADCSSAIACQITTVAHVCADMIGGDRCPHRWWPVAAATCSLTRSVGQTKPPGHLKKETQVHLLWSLHCCCGALLCGNGHHPISNTRKQPWYLSNCLPEATQKRRFLKIK